MVEFLGPEFVGQQYPFIAQQIIKFTQSPVAGIRQAASYGIGMIAQHGGAAYAPLSNDCL